MTKRNGRPCTRCNTSKWYSNGNCVECKRVKNLAWNATNVEQRKRLNAQWAIDNKEHHNERMKLYQQNNKKYTAAHSAVYQAIKKGRLAHPTTLVCGHCTEMADEYHHPSYDDDKRLFVIALCMRCHGKEHRLYK